MAATARAVDDAGFRDLTLMDHWFQMVMLGGPGEPLLEGYPTLGYVAACTERVRLGLLVTGVTYRLPGLLARTVATLDVLTGIAETLCEPRPVQRPHPPIVVGGSGEEKTLRLVARYADACNLFATSPDEVAHKLDVLAGHCADLGRDPGSIERSLRIGGNPLDDVDAFVSELAAYAAVGIQTVALGAPGADCADLVREVGRQVVPHAAEL